MNSFLNSNSNFNHLTDNLKPIFWNFSLDKGRLKSFVSWFLKNYGEKKTIELLEQLSSFNTQLDCIKQIIILINQTQKVC